MLYLLIGALIVYHVTNVITTGVIFAPLRDRCPRRWKLDYLVRCQLCAGTWVGLGVGAILPLPGLPLGRLLSGLAYKGLAHGILALFTAVEHAGNAHDRAWRFTREEVMEAWEQGDEHGWASAVHSFQTAGGARATD